MVVSKLISTGPIITSWTMYFKIHMDSTDLNTESWPYIPL